MMIVISLDCHWSSTWFTAIGAAWNKWNESPLYKMSDTASWTTATRRSNHQNDAVTGNRRKVMRHEQNFRNIRRDTFLTTNALNRRVEKHSYMLWYNFWICSGFLYVFGRGIENRCHHNAYRRRNMGGNMCRLKGQFDTLMNSGVLYDKHYINHKVKFTSIVEQFICCSDQVLF